MNQVCRNTASFGATAHMCTADEFFRSAGIPSSLTTSQLWVQPSLSNCVYQSTGEIMCQEAGLSTGAFDTPTNLYNNCSAWTSTTVTGTSVLFTTGTAATTGWQLVSDTDCSKAHRVACCK